MKYKLYYLKFNVVDILFNLIVTRVNMHVIKTGIDHYIP